MKRRTLLQSAAASSVLWAPSNVLASEGAMPGEVPSVNTGHNAYFSALNELLKQSGPGRPVMLIDQQAMLHNVDSIVRSVGPDKTYRVVVKSLPSVPLLRAVMQRAKTSALMVFHQPFLNEVAVEFPESDVLIGKPMPVAAARTFFAKFKRRRRGFDPSKQIQWLIDSPQRLTQYQQLARDLGVHLRLNFELDVGLHRGGLTEPDQLQQAVRLVAADSDHLSIAGLMGYEPHLTGMKAELDHPAVQSVLDIYQRFQSVLSAAGYDISKLTMNGAGSHTLKIYEKDNVLNDLSAGSGVVMPTDFDTWHLRDNRPALFIATPILKRYQGNPFVAEPPELLERLYYIYGGYWKAQMVSPENTGEPIYQSTNQSPITTSAKVDLQVDDYMFLRPTQSEFVMLQFGDLLTVEGGVLGERWRVFHQTG